MRLPVVNLSTPTAHPALNTLLHELLDGARGILGDNFYAAYLHGSFATGEGDEHSDVDFVVVTRDALTVAHQDGLQALHRRLFVLDTPWAQHLEGSYAPSGQLRQLDWSRRPFFFLGNGAAGLAWDGHCNTAVVRWLLRECGVVLAGPDPGALIDPVSASDLRREAAGRVQEYADWAPEPDEVGPMSRWKQPYLVLTFCRLLYTLAEGRVASKRDAADWAVGVLEQRWASLIREAKADRADPWRRIHQAAAPDRVECTLAFADYAVAEMQRRVAWPV